MARSNNIKRKRKTQKKNPTILTLSFFIHFLLFILGTIGEAIIIPIKNIFAFVLRFLHLTAIPYFERRLHKVITRVRIELSLLRISPPIHVKEIFSQLSLNINKLPTVRGRRHFSYPPINFYEWKKRGNAFFKNFGLILFGCIMMLIVVIMIEMHTFIRSLPNPRLLTSRDIPMTTKIFDRKGILLYELFIDENRTLIPLREIPKVVQEATIAIEDRDFYSHHGFSLRGMLRATRETLFRGNIQGGSTITQQLIKSALLGSEITLERKIKELMLAFWTEQLYTKEQILEMYLNQVPYGGSSWGIESASRTFFNKPVQEIDLAEAAYLAGLPAAPSEYSPYGLHPEKAFIRQHEVLRRMVEESFITEEEATQAKDKQLLIASPRIPIKAPHFVLYVKDLLLKKYGERQLLQGGLQVYTTLDLEIQEKIEQIVASEIEKLDYLNVGNGSVLVTEPSTGAIIAMVGSKNYFDNSHDGNVNLTTALRQPGSSIKVVTYTAALENGMTAATLLNDSPISFNIPGQPAYTPVNYDGRWHGLVPLRYALGNSYNIPAVKTMNTLGLMTVIEKGRKMGINTWEDPSRFGLSLTLGGGEVTMMDMAEVYGTLANQGKRMDLYPILKITNYLGNTIEEGNPAHAESVVSPGIAWIMSNILSDNAARTQAFGPNSNLVIPGKTVSVKTGTTNEKRDNWTIGFTPSIVVTVWVGNNDNSPMHPQLSSGITGAAPIWQKTMIELLTNRGDELPIKPETIVSLPCYFGRVEYFIKGTEPKDGRCAALPTNTPSPTQSIVQMNTKNTHTFAAKNVLKKNKLHD